MNMNRRTFLEKSGVATGAALVGGVIPGVKNETAKTQTRLKPPRKDIKIGLYTVTYLGIWYDGPALSFSEIVERAKRYGYDSIELDNKRPLGMPMDIDQRKRYEMRNIMEKNGIEMPCVAANNDFSSPIPEHREMNLLMIRETARLAADLGAKIVRLFAAWYGVPIHNGAATYDLVRGDFYTFERQYPYATWLERYHFVRDCLKEAAAIGEEFGVTMALQNHGPLIRHWKDMYDLVRDVNSPWLKACLDLPIMTRLDHPWVEEAVRTVGDLQIHTHFGGEYFRDESGKVQQMVIPVRFGRPLQDYTHFIKMMREIGYEGHITYELCHPVLNEKHEIENLDFVHNHVEMAQEFMRNIINET